MMAGEVIISLLLLTLVPLFHVAQSQHIVTSLPGYPGDLPFKLETGYIGVGELDDIQLFYYFIESERDPRKDPLLLWLTGGPGCSGFSGLVYEIGPLNFNYTDEWSLPRFELNKYSWTKVASIIFLDQPVGTGFSYATTSEGYADGDNDINAARYTYEFLRKGYSIGNPIVDEQKDMNWRVPYAYRVGLISADLYESIAESCQGDYLNVDPKNTDCARDVRAVSDCINNVNTAQILEPTCRQFSPAPVHDRRVQSLVMEDPHHFISLNKQLPEEWCRTYHYIPSYVWANDEKVQAALGIREGTISEWLRCNKSMTYYSNIDSTFVYHQNLTGKYVRALVYRKAFSWTHELGIPLPLISLS